MHSPHPPTTNIPFVPGGLHPEPEFPANLRERQVRNVAEPSLSKPTDQEFYIKDQLTGEKKPNPALLKEHFFREGRLREEHAIFILERATDKLSREPNMVDVESPVTICGDIHGQYYDLMKLFEVGGSVQDNSYLFLGDYVDRGCFGIECLLYLYTLKIWYPKEIVLLRGNHECRHLTEYFTFRRECLHKYSTRVYNACLKSFCALPIAALVDGRFFCVHGGISPDLHVLEDVHRINRFQEPESNGLFCDLLWSDPIVNFGHEQEPTAHGPGLPPGTTFLPNSTRGCSYYFTYEAACQFLATNKLLGIIRGHEAQDAGYTMHRKTPTRKFPSVITIFSAPNYLDVYQNRGAVLKYANKNITIRQYNSSSHPYWLPNFMDAFTWSLPFVGSKITEMLLAILSICSEEELEADTDEDDDVRTIPDKPLTPKEVSARKELMKSKILAVGKMQRVFQLLREGAENAMEFSGTTVPTDGAPGPDALGVQVNQVRRNIHSFAEARRFDIANERLPSFDLSATSGIFPAPSMRLPNLAIRESGEDGGAGMMSMEMLIKKTLEEDLDEGDDSVGGLGGYVDRIAENIATGRRGRQDRPRALKRFETA